MNNAFSDAALKDRVDFFENAPIGLHIVDPDGVIMMANRRELNLLGYASAPGDYIGHSITEFHAERQVIEDMLQKLVSGVSLVDYRARILHKDGTAIPVVIHSNPRMDNGSFVNTRCMTYPEPGYREPDTPQPSAVAMSNSLLESLFGASPQSRERLFGMLEDFFENAPIGLHIVGADGIILRANKAELAGLGYENNPMDYVGHHIAKFHASSNTIEDMLATLVGGRPLIHYKAEMVRRDGAPFHVVVYSSPRMSDGEFLNTRCFSFPALGDQAAAPVRFEWPSNEETPVVGAVPAEGSGAAADARTMALRYVLARRRLEEALGFLAETSKALTALRTYRTTVSRAANLSVPYLADWCSIDRISENGSLELLAVARVSKLSDRSERLAEFIRGNDTAAYSIKAVCKSGETAACFDVCASAKVNGDSRADALRELGAGSILVVPLSTSRGRVGALSLVRAMSAARPPFGPADAALAEEFGRRLSSAIEAGELYELAGSACA